VTRDGASRRRDNLDRLELVARGWSIVARDDSALTVEWWGVPRLHLLELWQPKSEAVILAELQRWRCPLCRQALKLVGSSEPLEIHHRRRLADGGSDELENLALVHRSCHREHHRGDE
jgi:5-methylcytosine-specific restriction endonuclease McrA